MSTGPTAGVSRTPQTGYAGSMPWTYMLACADGTLYVGSTIDLTRRLAQHQAGEGSRYTSRRDRQPVRLVWSGHFDRIDDAFWFEKQVRGWGRQKRIALMEGRWEDLPELSRRPGARRAADDG